MGDGASMEGVKVVGGMVATQAAFAVGNIVCKLALNDGMDGRIYAAYRYLFATAFSCPLVFFFERHDRPRITWKELMLAFLNGLFGGSLFQYLFLVSMQLISVTFVSAMFNLLPAITFVLAVLFRMEKLKIGAVSSQAKVAGTLVGIGGAMILTFYKGRSFRLWPTHINLLHSVGGGHHYQHHNGSGNQVMGSLFAVISCLSYATWLIIQTKVSKQYPHSYRNSTMLCLMAAIQCTVFALCGKRDLKSWRIGFDVRLLAVVYTGLVPSALTLVLLNWCIRKKGPLFASVFSPLGVIIVAILGSLLLDENLNLGSVLGSVLIVLGLYVVIWGKGREMTDKVSDEHPAEDELEPSMAVITVDPPDYKEEEK